MKHRTNLVLLHLILLLTMSCSSSSESVPLEEQSPQIEISASTTGRVVTLQATVTGTAQVREYDWDFGDGFAAKGQNVVHVYEEPGTYRVELRCAAGTTDYTETQQVTIEPSMDCGNTWRYVIDRRLTYMDSVVGGEAGFVAVGKNGALYHSRDGLDWCPVATYRQELYQKVIYARGAFWVLGTGSYQDFAFGQTYTRIFSSTDGLDWSAVAYLPGRVHELAYNGMDFVALGDILLQGEDPREGPGNYGLVYHSSDGISWQETQRNGTKLESLVWSGSHWLIEGYSEAGRFTNPSRFFLMSNSGIQWEGNQRDFSFESGPRASSESHMIQLVDGIEYSEDGIEWEKIQAPTGSWHDVIYSAGKYVVLSSDSIIVSENGRDWTLVYSWEEPRGAATKLATNGVWWLVVEPKGVLLWSADGRHWAEVSQRDSVAEEGEWRVVRETDTGFVVGGANGRLGESQNGIHWDISNITEDFEIRDIAETEMGLLAVGDTDVESVGQIWVRENQIWRIVYQSEASQRWVAAIGERFMSIDEAGNVTYGQQGQVMGVQYLGIVYELKNIENQFWALGQDRLYVSETGQNWETRPYPHLDVPTAFINYEGQWLIAGYQNQIAARATNLLHSNDGYQWEELVLAKGTRINEFISTETGVIAGGSPYFSGYQAQPPDEEAALFLETEDGQSWQAQSAPPARGIQSMAHQAGISLAVTINGQLMIKKP